MGLMDKVKAQATQIAQKTQETAREGKARLDQVQANRRADAMLRDLGALVYADRTNRGTPGTQDQITKLIGEISAHEAENGIDLATPSTGWPGPGMPPQAAPPEAAPPQAAPPEGVPPQGAPGGSAGPASTSFPDSAGGGTSFPESAGGTGFPPEA